MKISVVTVCFNSVNTIEQTIQSIVCQGYSDLEYIIIDGGSSDGTLDIIKKYRRYITSWISEPDCGIYDAMNKGLKKCTGEIIAFLNSDDWYEKDTLKKVEHYFMSTMADIVSGNVYLYSDGQVRKMELDREDEENVFFKVIYPHPALFVRHDFFNKMGGYDTSYKIAADTAWIINAYTAGATILSVEDCFTYFRIGGLSCQRSYEGLKECYKAAYMCAQSNGMELTVRRVEEYYSTLLKDAVREQKLVDALNNNIAEVKKLFDYNRRYYIWGAGERGRACQKLFTTLEIPIAGFIDRNPDKKDVEGYPVVPAGEIAQQSFICITPKGYEREIMEQLILSGMDQADLLVYADLLEQIAELGKYEEI